MEADLDRLAEVLGSARKRGFRRVLAAALLLVSFIPAFVATVLRQEGYGDASLIIVLFLFVPTAVLMIWTVRDQEGQAARELVMWLNSIRRAITEGGSDVPLDQLPEAPNADAPPVRFQELVIGYRNALSPLVVSPGALGVRIAIYRFWYPIVAVIVELLLVIGFVVVLALARP